MFFPIFPVVILRKFAENKPDNLRKTFAIRIKQDSDWRLISEWQCKDTAFFWNHQILRCDKGRFSAAFNLKQR